jgi:hypothetical protein
MVRSSYSARGVEEGLEGAVDEGGEAAASAADLGEVGLAAFEVKTSPPHTLPDVSTVGRALHLARRYSRRAEHLQGDVVIAGVDVLARVAQHVADMGGDDGQVAIRRVRPASALTDEVM